MLDCPFKQTKYYTAKKKKTYFYINKYKQKQNVYKATWKNFPGQRKHWNDTVCSRIFRVIVTLMAADMGKYFMIHKK